MLPKLSLTTKATWLAFVLQFSSVSLAQQRRPSSGSGNDYLQQTEQGPWFTGSSCECNQWSSRCRFNEQMYQETGQGGECMDCDGNKAGQHCDRCKPDHYESKVADELGRTPCEACNCDPTGSESTQCSPDGICTCKDGVTGDKCDKCAANYWNFGEFGCETCDCLREGSLDNTPDCDQETGVCNCKQNVEGQRCDRPKAGHFYIDEENEFGATPCFCYGHTAECEISEGYMKTVIGSDFSRGDEDWATFEDGKNVPLKHDYAQGIIAVQSAPDYTTTPTGAYFSAPAKFLGDQRFSYNQELTFQLKIVDQDPIATQEDIVIVGGGAKQTRISLSITSQNNSLPGLQKQDYNFRLHENDEFGWTPSSMSSMDFMTVLSNITSLHIRGSYVTDGKGFLDNFKMNTAKRGLAGEQAKWIERCQCPAEYQGQFCEQCVEGFFHLNNGGPFAKCIPCKCNNHADTCDPESGKCECRDNTDGHECGECARGFYGNALAGTPQDCQPCPCPDGGPCMEVLGNIQSPKCTECPTGRMGFRCEKCEDGYFGDPMGEDGEVRPCQKCECNGNVDKDAIGNCDGSTGECLRCIDNTDGPHCEVCKNGFFGDALALKKPGDPPSCQVCQCYPLGTNIDSRTSLPVCSSFTGDCSCKAHVVGQNCDKCKDGYFNLDSGEGCDPCNCDPTGSFNQTCHDQTGQCFCRPGVTGKACDQCLPQHFGFSEEGCKECDCDPEGSTDPQCDLVTGQCQCRDKVEGRKCDRCMENTRSKDTGGGYGVKICEPCDDCYNLVSDAANEHRQNLESLNRLLLQIRESPEPVEQDFVREIRQLQIKVRGVLADARINSRNEEGGTLRDRLEDLSTKLEQVHALVTESDTQIENAKQKSERATQNVFNAKDIIDEARESLKNAQKLLENDGREALRKAEERSKKFGEESEKMSAIAREARRLAEQQVEDASEIESIAKQAYETSNNAYDMARAAMEEQTKTGSQIKVLEEQVKLMSSKLRTVQSLAGQTSRDATDAYNTAINIYQQAKSIEVPSIDEENIEKQANRVQEEANQIKLDANQLIESNINLLQETQDRRVQLQDLLTRAEGQQQTLDRQLADMDGHRAKALAAVADGNSVLDDAQRTLRTLNDFENTVNANKEAAIKALDEVDRIKEVIQQARDKTNEAKDAMNGAETSAQLALNVAMDAEKIAKEASEKASIIKDKAAESQESASELASATNSLTNKLDETKSRLTVKADITAQDGQSALSALEKANQAQTKAKDASEKVEKAKQELEEISAILSTVQEPEPGLLEALKFRVEAAEQKFKAAELDDRLSEFEAARQRQGEQMRDLQRELKYMEEESENVKSISDSLPIKCPKRGHCMENEC